MTARHGAALTTSDARSPKASRLVPAWSAPHDEAERALWFCLDGFQPVEDFLSAPD